MVARLSCDREVSRTFQQPQKAPNTRTNSCKMVMTKLDVSTVNTFFLLRLSWDLNVHILMLLIGKRN